MEAMSDVSSTTQDDEHDLYQQLAAKAHQLNLESYWGKIDSFGAAPAYAPPLFTKVGEAQAGY